MNVILFLPDQWRAEAVGCLGNKVVKTPHTDALAAEGVAFRNCFTQNPVCTPTRCTLLTGQFCHTGGHRTMHHFVRRHEPNLMRYLRDAGYFLWWGGKNDAIPLEDTELCCDVRYHGDGKKGPTKPAPKPGDRHFYTFYRGCVSEEPMHLGDDDVVDHAVEFLARKHQTPFCMWINQGLPHPPYAAEREWCEMYPLDVIRPLKPRVIDGKPGILDAIRRKAGLDKLTAEEFRAILATYYAMCSRVDRNFGRVIDAVKENGLWENTAILLAADHGDFGGDYEMVEKTQNTFEDVLTNVPLVIRVPGGKPHSGACDALVQSMDLFATLMELTGAEARHTHFSKSLMPIVRGETDEHRQFVCCEGGARIEEVHTHENPKSHTPEHVYHPRITIQNQQPELHGKAVMLRTHDWKYVRRLYDTDELYELTSDPDELRNVVNDPARAEIVREMRDRMLTWFLDTGDAVPFRWDKRSENENILEI
ncbi:MAG: hypothetical protein AMS16_03185 [Planctomycetes bacterium DG_58]|nr:MAG: hypothetical protein AMS16_03185 [Planctomycetes bacterium DG_58]